MCCSHVFSYVLPALDPRDDVIGGQRILRLCRSPTDPATRLLEANLPARPLMCPPPSRYSVLGTASIPAGSPAYEARFEAPIHGVPPIGCLSRLRRSWSRRGRTLASYPRIEGRELDASGGTGDSAVPLAQSEDFVCGYGTVEALEIEVPQRSCSTVSYTNGEGALPDQDPARRARVLSGEARSVTGPSAP
jgi:hypothetical protein